MKEKRKRKKDSCRGREVENSGIFPPPDFMSRLCPLPRHFMVRVVAILCEHGVARSWNASPLPSFSSISRTILRDTRQLDVLLQRDTYIYILSIRTRTHLLFVPVQGELIITSVLRSPSKSLVVEERWRRWNFYFLFMREEDLAIFIELGKKNDKVSFIIICRP